MIKKMYSLVLVSALLAGVFVGTSWAHQQVAVVPLNTGSKPIGDAVAADVLKGKTFSNADTIGMVGVRPPVPVAKTGQTSTVPLDVTAIDGADGQLGKGVAWPNPRFTDNSNGTVTDNLTGLVWLQNANCFGQKNWATALTDANTLNTGECGLTDSSVEGDWRLPNRKELDSLLALQYSNPILSNDAGDGKWANDATSAFTSVQSDYYWSSTTYADHADFAWNVNLNYGFVSNGHKTSSYYVWPVRD